MNVRQDFCGQLELNLLMGLFLQLVFFFFFLMSHEKVCGGLGLSGNGEDLRVLWTTRRSNQSVLKEINPKYSLDGLMVNEAEAPVRWPPDVKGQLTGKDPDARNN